MMLAISTACICFFDNGGRWQIVAAILLFIWGGGLVEFWWQAIAMCVAAWFYCRRPGWFALFIWVISTTALVLINRNFWALAAFPVIFAAPYIRLQVPRIKMMFYAYYPAHLAVFWILTRFVFKH